MLVKFKNAGDVFYVARMCLDRLSHDHKTTPLSYDRFVVFQYIRNLIYNLINRFRML